MKSKVRIKLSEITPATQPFKWILLNDRNACKDIGNSQMIRELVNRYNKMVIVINKLIDVIEKGENYDWM